MINVKAYFIPQWFFVITNILSSMSKEKSRITLHRIIQHTFLHISVFIWERYDDNQDSYQRHNMSTNGHFFNNCFTIYQKSKIELMTLLPFSIPYSCGFSQACETCNVLTYPPHVSTLLLFAFLTILSFFSWRLFLSKAVYIFCQKCVPIPINLLHFLNKHVFILNNTSEGKWWYMFSILLQIIYTTY